MRSCDPTYEKELPYIIKSKTSFGKVRKIQSCLNHGDILHGMFTRADPMHIRQMMMKTRTGGRKGFGMGGH